jgi:hypothetical protein
MADAPPALTGVSPEAQELMTACGGAMTTTCCVNMGSGAHDSANATFEEAASRAQLEELGHSHKISPDGILFSREPVAEEYDPSFRTAAAAFLGLEGSVELGSLDQVLDVPAYRGFNCCPVLLVCSKSKEKG